MIDLNQVRVHIVGRLEHALLGNEIGRQPGGCAKTDGDTLMLGLLIIRREKESLVCFEGPTQGSSKLLTSRRHIITKHRARGELAMSKVIKAASVKLV